MPYGIFHLSIITIKYCELDLDSSYFNAPCWTQTNIQHILLELKEQAWVAGKLWVSWIVNPLLCLFSTHRSTKRLVMRGYPNCTKRGVWTLCQADVLPPCLMNLPLDVFFKVLPVPARNTQSGIGTTVPLGFMCSVAPCVSCLLHIFSVKPCHIASHIRLQFSLHYLSSAWSSTSLWAVACMAA